MGKKGGLWIQGVCNKTWQLEAEIRKKSAVARARNQAKQAQDAKGGGGGEGMKGRAFDPAQADAAKAKRDETQKARGEGSEGSSRRGESKEEGRKGGQGCRKGSEERRQMRACTYP